MSNPRRFRDRTQVHEQVDEVTKFKPSYYSAKFLAVSSQHMDIANGSTTGLNLAGNATWEFWLKLTTLPADSSAFVVMNKGPFYPDWAGLNYMIGIYNDATDYNIQFYGGDGGSTGNHSQIWSPVLSPTISAGVWYHIAVSYASTAGTLKFYVNGAQLGSDVATVSTHATSTDAFLMGYFAYGGNNYLNGQVASIRIWNTTRSITEISNNMSICIPSATGLVASWVFPSQALTDASGNNNTLVNTGATFLLDMPF